MDDNIAEIDQQPAALGNTLCPGVNLILRSHFFDDYICQGADHPIAGTGANDEIVGEVNLIADIHQHNVLSFMLFEQINNFSCGSDSVQNSLLLRSNYFTLFDTNMIRNYRCTKFDRQVIFVLNDF